MLGNLQSEWARLFVDALVASGVRHAVLSPGSRSTPFVWAALEHPNLQCHSIIDERSAGFFALGLAKVSGEPSLLLCTSGSAGAHYLPALVEAKHTGTPLLVVTADRPFRLMKRGASQTIDQTHLFGGTAKEFFELGAASDSRAALVALQQTAVQAVWVARSSGGGPVHVNARADKPLEPRAAHSAAEQDLQRTVSELIERGPTRAALASYEANARDFESLVHVVERARHGLIVCGTIDACDTERVDCVLRLAKRAHFGVLAELPSQIGLLDAAEGAYRRVASFCGLDELSQHAPDLVLELGTPLVSRHYERFSAGLAHRRHVISPRDWSDATATAGGFWQADPLSFAERLLGALTQPDAELASSRRQWLERLADVDARTEAAISKALREEPFGEAHAAREIARALPKDSLLVVGNSLPIRALNAFAEGSSRGIGVVTQRGASGIDGMVAGAAGAAAHGLATTLVLGDVTLAHDLGSLQLLRALDLCIVVIDNQGGRIFEHLPWGLAERAPEKQKYWVTPPELDLDGLCSAFGIGLATAKSAAELGQAMADAHRARGPQMVRVVVSPRSYQRVVERVENELRGS